MSLHTTLLTQDVTGTDLFCGAGGMSIALEAAGGRLHMAANHWPVAIETHSINFPAAHHDCADISQVDPRRYPTTTILTASPECTHHSNARTRRHVTDLFDPKGDPAADRSRATMWDVVRFAEYHRYEIVVVENVVEVVKWAPFDAWLQAMVSLGYRFQLVSLNSMTAHPVPQSRDRLYMVFWREGNRTPDLDFRPSGICPDHGVVAARQVFKNPHCRVGKYRSQYLYRCTEAGCDEAVALLVYPAASALDFSIPCQRIGDRKKPLSPYTMARIRKGMVKFGPGARQLVPLHHGGRGPGPRSVYDVWPTQTTRQEQALFEPFIAELRGGGSDARLVSEPMATVCASGNHHGLVTPPGFLVKNYGDGSDPSMAFPFTAPLGTVTTQDHHSVVAWEPFLSSYYGNGSNSPVSEPMPTLRTHDAAALVDPSSFDIYDAGFRMCSPPEVGRGMGFPDSYRVTGTQRDRVKQYGNAVTPPAPAAIVGRCIESLAYRRAAA